MSLQMTGKCDCPSNWTGNRCERDVDECAMDRPSVMSQQWHMSQHCRSLPVHLLTWNHRCVSVKICNHMKIFMLPKKGLNFC